jgi:hypothetical protein
MCVQSGCPFECDYDKDGLASFVLTVFMTLVSAAYLLESLSMLRSGARSYVPGPQSFSQMP